MAVIDSIWGECRPHSISPDFAIRGQSDLRDYQRWMFDQIREKAAVLLAVPMSMVKNPAVLIAARELLDEFVRPAKRAIHLTEVKLPRVAYRTILTHSCTINQEAENLGAAGAMLVAAKGKKMSRLNYLSEREWVIYTIEEELDNLERLAPPRDAFSAEELNSLRQSAVRLNRLVSNLDSDVDEEPLPHWLQRKPSDVLGNEDDDDDKSAASA